ncbi:protein prickle-like [Triticum dicoccoides]|uniref:protein prickle-like n=1 Tax=Triticum dicoccoides TaxID=85692 RepID=UPI00188E2D28|nr:protein prickle-like [Triticum dicoccoides]
MQQARAGEESSSVHTVNAAAVVLAAAAQSSTGLRPHHHHHLHHHHHDHDTSAAATKKRWWSRLSSTLCFRPHFHADGDTPPRPPATASHTASASAYVHQAPPAHPVFAFAAPPSSPASSLFQSEAPSPVLLDLHGTAGSSPGMFAVGPYARGPQQLVSPPVLYSALTTEPSTAPRTPPATTGPSSPEVPFARFVVDDGGHELLFHHAAYQLRQQGRPAPLVSPGPEPGSPSSPWLFRRLHRRDQQGSLLDGHVPVASSCAGADARDVDDDEDEEVPDSAGEFVFGHADGRGAAPEEEIVEGKKWHFFPMATGEQHAKM